MNIDKVVQNLCYHDKRNPNYYEKEVTRRKECMCDNCFYGRHTLAEEILRLEELIGLYESDD